MGHAGEARNPVGEPEVKLCKLSNMDHVESYLKVFEQLMQADDIVGYVRKWTGRNQQGQIAFWAYQEYETPIKYNSAKVFCFNSYNPLSCDKFSYVCIIAKL